jgi:hypothetical protein
VPILRSTFGPAHFTPIGNVRGVCFFEVVNATPESRSLVGVPHLTSFRDCVNVNICTVFRYEAAAGTVMLFKGRNRHQTIRLLPIVASLETVYPEFFLWSVLKQKPIQMAAVSAISQLSLRSPAATYPFPVYVAPSALVDASAFGVTEPDHPLAFLDASSGASDLAVFRCLVQLEKLSPRADEWLPFELLDSVHMNLVNALVTVGAVETQIDDLGELKLRRSGIGLRWTLVHLYGNPIQCARLSGCSSQCKLDALSELHRGGWRPHPNIDGAWRIGEHKLYHPSLARPFSYFTCLLECEALMAKGVESIPHLEKDAYYRCLLRLSAASLALMLSTMPADADNDWFKSQLVDGEDEPFEDELLALEDEPPEEGEPRPALSCLVPPAVEIELPQFWDRCWMRIGDASPRYKCYFDQGTHQSNRPRGWVNCETHQCIKYMWADTFDSRESFCAFAYAWLTLYHSDHPCKGDHLSFTPTTEQVKAVADNLCLESF